MDGVGVGNYKLYLDSWYPSHLSMLHDSEDNFFSLHATYLTFSSNYIFTL